MRVTGWWAPHHISSTTLQPRAATHMQAIPAAQTAQLPGHLGRGVLNVQRRRHHCVQGTQDPSRHMFQRRGKAHLWGNKE